MDLATELCEGRLPSDDGWHWLYRSFDWVAPKRSRLRRGICRYFLPKKLERSDGFRLYRLLGVPWFGRVIPTGGIAIRRLTGRQMAAYTLRGTSVGAARDFYYRACVFEALHLPFLLTLLALTVRQLALGRLDLALQDTVVNLVFNIYPIMHHRHTRTRIAGLLDAAATSRTARRTHS